MSEEKSNVESTVSEVVGNDENLQKKVEVVAADLQIVVNIIEAVTARGAFRAPELKGIGDFYERILSMIPKDNKSNATTGQ